MSVETVAFLVRFPVPVKATSQSPSADPTPRAQPRARDKTSGTQVARLMMIVFPLSDDEVYTFQWEQYLRDTGTVAAPPDLFKKVS